MYGRKRVWKRLLWSFTALFHGCWPATDDLASTLQAGSRQLAGGFRGILYVINGDLDYLDKALFLPSCNSANMCCWCPANLTNIPWWELKPGSTWMAQLYTALTVLAGVCAIFQVPGVSLMTVAPDWMHNKHLGTDMYFYGSVLWLLCYVLLEGTPEANMDIVLEDIKAEYRKQGIACRFQNITLGILAAHQYTEHPRAT